MWVCAAQVSEMRKVEGWTLASALWQVECLGGPRNERKSGQASLSLFKPFKTQRHVNWRRVSVGRAPAFSLRWISIWKHLGKKSVAEAEDTEKRLELEGL